MEAGSQFMLKQESLEGKLPTHILNVINNKSAPGFGVLCKISVVGAFQKEEFERVENRSFNGRTGHIKDEEGET